MVVVRGIAGVLSQNLWFQKPWTVRLKQLIVISCDADRGQLELGQPQVLLDLLKPEGAFMQGVLKAANERIYYEINLDVLPVGFRSDKDPHDLDIK